LPYLPPSSHESFLTDKGYCGRSCRSRPLPLHASLFSFLSPPVSFLPSLGSSRTTDAHLHLHTLFLALRIVGLWTAGALLVALPLFTVGLPCLASLRGRGHFSGSLADLSLLRLLSTLDSDTTPQLSKRADVSPPLASSSSARTRLLVLTILVPFLVVLPNLFLVIRTARHFVAYRDRFLAETCGGLEMVWLPIARAGLGERAMQGLFTAEGLWSDRQGPSPKAASKESREARSRSPGSVTVLSLAGIPNTIELDKLIEERSKALHRLEESETAYIEVRLATCIVAGGDPRTDIPTNAELRDQEWQ
jgi:hypothetical protein